MYLFLFLSKSQIHLFPHQNDAYHLYQPLLFHHQSTIDQTLYLQKVAQTRIWMETALSDHQFHL